MPSNSNKTRSVSHCHFPFSDGRRCSLPISPTHPRFCLTHALRERRLLGAEQIAAELAAMSTQIRTANDLNHFLTRLVFYTASQRIPKSTARTLAYLASLLLQTLPSVKNEVSIAHGYEEWRQLLRQTVPDASGDPPYPSEPDLDANSAGDSSSGTAPSCPEPRGVGVKSARQPFGGGAGFSGPASKPTQTSPSAATDPKNHEPQSSD